VEKIALKFLLNLFVFNYIAELFSTQSAVSNIFMESEVKQWLSQ